VSGRYRTVALQAVGVAILAAFVFVAFLRPSEPDDLSGIEAPGGGNGQTVVPPPDHEKKKGGKKGGNGHHKPNRGDRSNGTRANSNDRPGSGGGSPPDDTGTGTPPDGDGGPDDDQYTDLVSILMKQVGQPDMFKEINVP
jgi:hypothetical protein